MAGESHYVVLLDLDALLDTRMGTLLALDPEVGKYLDVQAYLRRDQDDFGVLTQGRITTEAFNARYQARDMPVLKHSIVSGILPVLMTYIESLEERYLRQVDVGAIRVDLNFYPYRLPGPILEMFTDCLRALLPPYVDVTAVHLGPEKLAPETLAQYYNGWVTYHFHPWLEMHQDILLIKPINQVAVILPRLVYREPGEDMVLTHDALKEADRHGLLELVMEDYIHLEHLPAMDFSFVTPGSYRLDTQSSSSASNLASAASTDETKSS